MTNDLNALFNIGYGLYVVTCNDGKKDNGLIVNTVTQVTNTPNRVAVTINKENYSHQIIKETNIMNVNCLSIDAPFKVFEHFGFQSGRNVNKFENCNTSRSSNNLVFLPKYINSFISLQVEQYIDLDTHGMFICTITEAKIINTQETMTYTYYHKHVKPKPTTEKKNGYICQICGYIYEGDTLPEDFICPLCKHGSSEFEPLNTETEQKETNSNKYECQICGYIYDEEKGALDLGIEPGTKFEDFPDNFTCPICGVPKVNFEKK